MNLSKKRKTTIGKRNRFTYNGLPVSAAGLILYKVEPSTNEFFLWLQKRKGVEQYEDLGGKVEWCDTCIEDTMCREAVEETRQFLEMPDLLDRVRHGFSLYFVSDMKYVFAMIPASYREIHTKVDGMEWISVQDLSESNLFARIRIKKFIKYLDMMRSLIVM